MQRRPMHLIHTHRQGDIYSSSFPALSSLHCPSSALTLSTPLTFPRLLSHSAHFPNTLLTLFPFPPALAARSYSALTLSSLPCARSSSIYTSHTSPFFGYVLTKPSKMVRPRSASPLVDLNSKAANF